LSHIQNKTEPLIRKQIHRRTRRSKVLISGWQGRLKLPCQTFYIPELVVKENIYYWAVLSLVSLSHYLKQIDRKTLFDVQFPKKLLVGGLSIPIYSKF